jgi:magnesium-transporting ATPase (P-type)
MMSEIAVGGLLILTLAIVYLKAPFVTNIFAQNANVLSGTHTVTQHLMTGFFGFFVFAAVFNAFNARTDRLNLFENIGVNKGFLRVIGLIVVIQAGLLYLGGAIFNCFGLTMPEWLVVLGFAIVIIPVDLIRKALTRQKI